MEDEDTGKEDIRRTPDFSGGLQTYSEDKKGPKYLPKGQLETNEVGPRQRRGKNVRLLKITYSDSASRALSNEP